MTGPDDAVAPHARAEADSRDPSRAANQVRDEPIAPGPADEEMPAAHRTQPDTATDDIGSEPAGTEPERPQAGVPEDTVTDVTPAPGTSEELRPVQGVHTPDVGPGGEQVDTADPASRSRAAGTTEP